MADIESDIAEDNAINNPENPEQRDVRVSPTVPGLIRPTQKSKGQAEKVMVAVNAIAMRKNKGV
jgi:hypothetical protein